MSLALKAARGGGGFVGDAGDLDFDDFDDDDLMGDPGLFGFVGGLVKKGLGVAGSILPGPVGLAARTLGGFIPGGGGPTITPRFGAPIRSRPGIGPSRAGPQVGRRDGRAAPSRGRGRGRGRGRKACPPGKHPNKSGYFRNTAAGPIFVPEGARCVKTRRRNPLNPRAADRAISRIESAKRATKRLSRITIKKTCP